LYALAPLDPHAGNHHQIRCEPTFVGVTVPKTPKGAKRGRARRRLREPSDYALAHQLFECYFVLVDWANQSSCSKRENSDFKPEHSLAALESAFRDAAESTRINSSSSTSDIVHQVKVRADVRRRYASFFYQQLEQEALVELEKRAKANELGRLESTGAE
jgi:hypothetical protein